MTGDIRMDWPCAGSMPAGSNEAPTSSEGPSYSAGEGCLGASSFLSDWDADLLTRWLRYFWSTEEWDRRGPHRLFGDVAIPDPLVKPASDRFARGVRVREMLFPFDFHTPEHRCTMRLTHERIGEMLVELGALPTIDDEHDAARLAAAHPQVRRLL